MQNHLLCKCPTLSLLDFLGIYLTAESLSLSVTVTQTHWRAQLTSFTSTASEQQRLQGCEPTENSSCLHSMHRCCSECTQRELPGQQLHFRHTGMHALKCQGKVGSDKLSPGHPWRRAAGVGSTMQNNIQKPAVLG